MAKTLSVKSGLLPTTVKPFQTYIISCGDEGQVLAAGADHPDEAGENVFSHQNRDGQFGRVGRIVTLRLLRRKLLRGNGLPRDPHPETVHLPTKHALLSSWSPP